MSVAPLECPRTVRIVVLTRDTRAGRHALAMLRQRRVLPAAVLVEAAFELKYCRRAITTSGRVWEFPLTLARSLWRRYRARRLVSRLLPGVSRCKVTGVLNGDRMLRDLAALRVDVLVIAGLGLVREEILALPRLGTIGAHPGLLPWVRGNGVVANSIERGIAIGASCFLVDRGVDTGAVIARRLLSVAPDEPLDRLEERALELAALLLADVTAVIAATGSLPPAYAQGGRYPLCRWPGVAQRERVSEAVEKGVAHSAFQRWRLLCTEDGTLDLPPSIPDGETPSLSP